MNRFTWIVLSILVYLAAAAIERVPAQTVVGPQTVNPPNVVSGADSSGTFTQRQVAYTDLAFPALFGLATTASNQVTVATGDQTFYLDYDPGYQLGYTVQVISLIDPTVYMTGRISAYSVTGGQSQITVSVTQDQGDSFTGSSWYIQIISSDAAFIPVTGVSLSSLTYGTGAGQISAGGVVSLTTETGLLLNNSHVVVAANGSPTNYFRGISQYNSSTGALQIYTTDSSGSGTFSAWSLFAQDGPPINANQIAVSQSNATLASGIIPFTIQAGQNLPIQGPVTITALSATSNQMLGTIYAYNSTTLSVLVPANGIYGSGNFGAWSILNTGPPQTRISLYQQNGLVITNASATNGINVSAGSIRDSTDTVDLSLSSTSTSLADFSSSVNVVNVVGAGTVSEIVGSFTANGVGTAFTSFFSTTATLTDLNNQLTSIGSATVSFPSIINNRALAASSIASITSDTVLTTVDDITITNGALWRGGKDGFGLPGAKHYGIVLARADATGVSDIFATSFTPSGAPDLPSGYTYFRVIGYIGAHTGIDYIFQPLLSARSLAPKAVYSATITPTSVSGSVSSVNTTTEVITWSTTHGLTTGQSVRGIGTVPTGWTVGQMFYVNALSTTTFALYTTLANALADTSRVNLTTTTTGATMVTLVPSNVFSVGFVSVGGVAGKPGSTSMGFDYNLSNALASTIGATNDMAFGLFSTAAAQINRQWTMGGARTFTSTTLVQTGTPGFSEDRAGVDNGTWAQQGTNAFTIQVWIWGALDKLIPANDNDLIEKAVA